MAESRVVLIVDDHQDTRELYATALVHAGYRVLSAADGVEALAAATVSVPALVISDIRMPGPVSAADLCRYFAALHIPVIVLTGMDDGSERDEILRVGCAMLAIKPFLPDALVETVFQLMFRADRRQSDV